MGIYWPSRRTPTNDPKALVFDMDGVLIDSEVLHKSTKRQALRSAGIEVDETVFSRYIGRSDRVMITDVAKIHGRSNDEIEAILAEKDRLYARTAGLPTSSNLPSISVRLESRANRCRRLTAGGQMIKSIRRRRSREHC
jgi:beta-phosphoglucomutase-like phosphatase (HAD superfamily)